MRRNFTALSLGLALALSPGRTPAQITAPVDPELARGIALVEDGEYDTAILTLDGAARRLTRDAARARELAQAYLYLGIAYMGKGHEAAARAKFREAVAQIKDLTLSPDKFPPKIIDAFEAARQEARTTPTAVATPSSPAPAPARRGGGSGKILLVVGGLAAAGAAAAVAAGGAAPSPAPAQAPRLPTANTAQLLAANPAAGSAISVSTTSSITIAFSLDVARPEGAVFCLFLDERDTVNLCFAGSCTRVSAGAGIPHSHPVQISSLASCRLPNPFSLAYDLNDDAGNKLFFQRVPAFYTISR